MMRLGIVVGFLLFFVQVSVSQEVDANSIFVRQQVGFMRGSVSDAAYCVRAFPHVELVDISEISTNFTVFPNPTRDYISISVDKNEPFELSLYTSNGLLLQKISGKNRQAEISLKNRDAGVYFLEISGTGFREIEKVIKLP